VLSGGESIRRANVSLSPLKADGEASARALVNKGERKRTVRFSLSETIQENWISGDACEPRETPVPWALLLSGHDRSQASLTFRPLTFIMGRLGACRRTSCFTQQPSMPVDFP
jgi:hypothetical protein